MFKRWARFFRVINLPTVPGDVLAGAAAVCAVPGVVASPSLLSKAAWAAAAAVPIYMFGLADNDIVGTATDKGRPIPDGEIALGAAKTAAVLCICAAVACGAAGSLPKIWWLVAAALVAFCAIYNRTKQPVVMGLCRGCNVLCGGAAVAGWNLVGWRLGALALVWTIYIAAVTKYSEGEEGDPAKKRRVGFLVGATIYLQLAALLAFPVKPFLVAGAALLLLLRAAKRLAPEVSAS